MIIDIKRRTGRTTRMLKAVAIYATGAGRSAVVVSENNQQSMANMDIVLGLIDSSQVQQIDRSNMVITLNSGVMIMFANSRNLDWRTMRLVGIDSECFVDHHAIECKFGPVLEEWCRYDDPTWPVVISDEQRPPARCHARRT